MEKKINNIVFLTTEDGRRITYNVLFTHHDEIKKKDFAVFVNEEDDDNIILLSYDENITFSHVNDEDEINMMNELLHQYDEEISDIIYEDEDLMLSKLNKYMYNDIYLNSLDEDNKKYNPNEVFDSLEETTEIVDKLIEAYDSEYGPYVYAIIRKNDLKNIGYVQLIYQDDFYEIGYHIQKESTRRGYATKAVKLFLKCLKEKTNAKEIYGISLKENEASIKVLQRCGFKLVYEGLGKYQDEEREIVKMVIDLSQDN